MRFLWISRHEMTREQWEDLVRVLGAAPEVRVWRDTVREMEDLRSAVEAADAVGAVLPPELFAPLLRMAGARPVLRAVSGRVPAGRVTTLPDGRQEREFDFVHQGWERVLRAEFVTRRLSGPEHPTQEEAI